MRTTLRCLTGPALLAVGALIAPHAMAIVLGLDIATPPGPPTAPSNTLSGTAQLCLQLADLAHPPGPCTDPISVTLVTGGVFHTDVVLTPPGPPTFLMFSFGGSESVTSGDSSVVLPAFAFLSDSNIPPGPPSVTPLLSLGALVSGLDVSGPIVEFSGVGTAFASFRVTAGTVADPFTVVKDGLQRPRGLTFGPDGRLYVAQAGAGGASGKITEIRDPWLANPAARDLITGLISTADEGEFASVAGLSAIGNGTIYAVMERSNAATGVPSRLGHLLKVSQGGQVRDVSNIGDFDFAWSGAHVSLAPHDFPDANPYAVLALSDQLYVADAGTNTLDLVHPDGSVEILAYFPNNIAADATPTCIAQGPDGALYVGTLALEDSLAFGPSAVVYRVDPGAADPANLGTVLSLATPWATGLWPINGCAFGLDGTFYASELITSPDFSGGDVIKIPFANPAVRDSLTGKTLTFPAGVAVGPDSSVYVSNGSAFVPQGQIVRLTNH